MDLVFTERTSADGLALFTDERCHGLAARVLHRRRQPRCPRDRQVKGERRALATHAIATKHPAVDHRLVEPRPGVRMDRVDASERGEELAGGQFESDR